MSENKSNLTKEERKEANRLKRQEEFIKKSKEKFGEDRFDYSKVYYTNPLTKVVLISKVDSTEFKIRPRDHLSYINGGYISSKEITQNFLNKLKDKYKDIYDLYDYSKVVYTKACKEVIIICPVHGEILVKPEDLLNKNFQLICPLCNKENKRKKKAQDFWENNLLPKLNAKYQGSLDFSETVFINTLTPITYRCIIHGYKTTNVYNLLSDNATTGCQECAVENRTIGLEEFIRRAREIHGDKYDYPKVTYVNVNVKVEIYCKKCKEYFWQTPSAHINMKRGCPKCSGRYQKTPEEYKECFENLLGYKFDFSLAQFNGRKTDVEIICKKCGSHFWKSPEKLLEAVRHRKNHEPLCPYCESPVSNWNTESFIEWMKSIWGDKYDYSKVVYINAKTKIELICPEHGSFLKIPNDIICHKHQENICPRCNISEGEIKTEIFLKDNNIKYKPQKVFKDLRIINPAIKVPHPLKFDFYLKEYNLCIEYQGPQHYMPIEKFGGEDAFKKQQKRDEEKRKYCKLNKISLLEIKYDIPLSKLGNRLSQLFKKLDNNPPSHIFISLDEEKIEPY